MEFQRGEKKLAAISIFVIAGSSGVGLFFNHLNAPPKVVIAPYPQAATPNGFDLYVAASKAIVLAKPAVDSVLDNILPADEEVARQALLSGAQDGVD